VTGAAILRFRSRKNMFSGVFPPPTPHPNLIDTEELSNTVLSLDTSKKAHRKFSVSLALHKS
jgi:hypothetical protein